MGMLESGLTFLVPLFFFGAIYLQPLFRRRATTAQVLYLLMMVGASGVVMTRDLFNLFVFLEILSIATYGLLALDDRKRALAAGFKYVIAGGIASALFLLGTIYLYRLTGTFNIDGMVAGDFPWSVPQAPVAAPALAAIFLVTVALLIELKPFPANGWALDVYEASHPGITSLLSIAASTAILSSVYKLMPLMPSQLLATLGGVGLSHLWTLQLHGPQADRRPPHARLLLSGANRPNTRGSLSYGPAEPPGTTYPAPGGWIPS